MNRVHVGIVLLLILLMLALPVLGQLATGHEPGWDVLSGGGGLRSSANYQIDDVLGQWANGRSNNANYQLDPGFWHAGSTGDRGIIFLPLTAR